MRFNSTWRRWPDAFLMVLAAALVCCAACKPTGGGASSSGGSGSGGEKPGISANPSLNSSGRSLPSAMERDASSPSSHLQPLINNSGDHGTVPALVPSAGDLGASQNFQSPVPSDALEGVSAVADHTRGDHPPPNGLRDSTVSTHGEDSRLEAGLASSAAEAKRDQSASTHHSESHEPQHHNDAENKTTGKPVAADPDATKQASDGSEWHVRVELTAKLKALAKTKLKGDEVFAGELAAHFSHANLEQLRKFVGQLDVSLNNGTACPVLKTANLGSMGPPVAVDLEGKTVLVCCPGCIAKLKREPGRYLAAAQEKEPEKILPAQPPATVGKQTLCPVTGEALESMGGSKEVVLKNGKKVRICCEGCKEDAVADSDATWRKVEADIAKSAHRR